MPQFEHLEARVGLSEPEFDAVVSAHLPELARCIAFAHWGKSGAERVTNPEKLDDRVQVELEKSYPDGFDDAPFRAKVEGVLSDKACVAATVRAWPWPKEQVAALETLEYARGPAVSFRHRFRPDDAALRWSAGFELRLLVARVEVPAKNAATAWPEVVTALRARRAASTLLDVAGALEGEDQFCPGVAAVGRRLGYGPPEESLVQLTRGLAEALRGCGCPHPFAELAWARMALALDDLTERIGWVPLNVTTDPKAPAIELRGRDEVQQLVKALGDAPVRVKLSAF